jgi:hypothetical protein
MDAISAPQVWGIVLFIIGTGILMTCSKWERKEADEDREVKNRYRDHINRNRFTKSMRANLLTGAGVLMSLVGVGLFFLNIKLD